ncbi:MAG: 6-carboxytetrahydropterin synthase QueD [Planctomycetota bacterium]
MRLVKSFDFEAAHWLPCFPEGHKCRRMHGHSFRVDVVVEGDVPQDQGYLIDYGDIKRAIEPVRLQLDHYCLNDIEGLENPTSEVLAGWIWERMARELPMLSEVVVHETCTSRCHYSGK